MMAYVAETTALSVLPLLLATALTVVVVLTANATLYV
jgi:hypothetical protein